MMLNFKVLKNYMQQISAGNKKNKEELEYRKAKRICRENPCFHASADTGR